MKSKQKSFFTNYLGVVKAYNMTGARVFCLSKFNFEIEFSRIPNKLCLDIE